MNDPGNRDSTDVRCTGSAGGGNCGAIYFDPKVECVTETTVPSMPLTVTTCASSWLASALIMPVPNPDFG
jgi:hypothetical protein